MIYIFLEIPVHAGQEILFSPPQALNQWSLDLGEAPSSGPWLVVWGKHQLSGNFSGSTIESPGKEERDPGF